MLRSIPFGLHHYLLAPHGWWPEAKLWHQYTFHTLYSFCAETNCTDGSGPQAALLMDGNSNLYGTTPGGGEFGLGTVSCADGVHPSGGVIEDSSGNIFGVTSKGGDAGDGGLAFKFSGGALHVLHKFSSDADGCDPVGGLIMVSGDLYSITAACGAFGAGTVFELEF